MDEEKQILPIEVADLSPLLVFGFAGRIGSGCSFVRNEIRHALASFGYDTVAIDVTKTFLENAERYLAPQTDGVASSDEASPPMALSAKAMRAVERVAVLQKNGNRFRKTLGDDALAALCISEIIKPHIDENQVLSSGTRTAYLIDSLKHPAEVKLLRKVFGEAFWMVGVVATEFVRFKRLTERKDYDEETFRALSLRDADEKGDEHGQKSIDTIVLADYFFSNNHDRQDDIHPECERLLKLIFGVEVQSPTKQEVGMNSAYKASRSSACLSRQVGAAIYDEDGQILATGCNDVPQANGGLYSAESDEDERCYARASRCYNDWEKNIIVDEVLAALGEVGVVAGPGLKLSDIRKAIMGSRIKDLIEFSRAVHAETDAIISIARSARPGIVGSTLYCTTFPCHNCAKNIIDAGIATVVYLEPYEKSLARKLHQDAINPSDALPVPGRVNFDLYGGVAPWRFDQVFSMPRGRKKDGQFVDKNHERVDLAPLGAQDSEILRQRIQRVVTHVAGKIQVDQSLDAQVEAGVEMDGP